MKKLISFTMFLCIFFSCEKDVSKQYGETPLVDQIEKTISNFYTSKKPLSLDKKNIQISSLDTLNDYTIIPFLNNLSTASLACANGDNLTSSHKGDNVNMLHTKWYRFVIGKEGPNNQPEVYILNAYPESDEIEYNRNPKEFFKLFSGLVTVTGMDSTFKSGYSMKDGIITGNITGFNQIEDADKRFNELISTKTADLTHCETWIITVYYQFCYWTSQSDIPYYCEPQVYSYVQGEITLCPLALPEGTGDPAGGGGSGSGNGTGPTRLTASQNPCQQSSSLSRDVGFSNHITQLQSNANQNYETAYVLTSYPGQLASTLFNFQYFQGQPNEHLIDLDYNGPIAGVIHSHFNGGFNSFSLEDIKSIYVAYLDGNIECLETFIMGVVNHEGGAYLLKVNDKTAFLNYCANAFANDATFHINESMYSPFVNQTMSTEAAESGLLSYLKIFNSGLSLVKGEVGTVLMNWQVRVKNENNTIVNSNCSLNIE